MRRSPRCGRSGPRRALRAAVSSGAIAVTALALALLLVPAGRPGAPATRMAWAASATGQSAAAAQPTLSQLEARAARLSRQYRGQLVSLDDAQRSARTATAREVRLRRQVSATRRRIVQLAVARYMGGAADPELAVLFSGDTAHLLGKSGVVEYLARQRTATMRELQGLVAASERAGQAARARLADLQRQVSALAGRRQAVDRLMAQFRPESPVTGGDRITARMRQVRDEVDRRFGPFPAIGCYRPESSGEHPLGRACDFMLSTGGVLPASSRIQLGYSIASWAQANASRLGIMYIIYRQRIWDARMPSSGWVPMEDRGSVTANHFDHVHISVF
ncbi:MAG TPA: hypothetical protein VGG35_03000 [Streptosporangiaceae bacterium]